MTERTPWSRDCSCGETYVPKTPADGICPKCQAARAHEGWEVAHRSERVKLYVKPPQLHDDAVMFDTRLDAKARQYVVTFDGRRVGTAVKLYRKGWVAARGCVGGSAPGYFEWYFFNDDGDGPDVTEEYIKKLPRSIEWELTRNERQETTA